MAQTKIPDQDHIVRLVPWAKVAKDDEDNVTGILWSAFQRSETDDNLSVNWLERADAAPDDHLRRTVELMNTGLKIGKKARIAVVNVGTVREICLNQSHKVRILHAPEDDNEPHSEIHRLPRDNVELLEILATEAVLAHYRCRDLERG